MNDWYVKQKNKIGPLALGMSADEIAHVLGAEFETFKRTPHTAETVYAYDTKAVHVTCDPANKVIVISAFRPNSVLYQGIQLLGRRIQDVVNELNANEISTEKEDAGYWVSEAGTLLVEVNGVVDGVELYPD